MSAAQFGFAPAAWCFWLLVGASRAFARFLAGWAGCNATSADSQGRLLIYGAGYCTARKLPRLWAWRASTSLVGFRR